MAPLRCVTVAVLVVREGALAVPARGSSGKRRGAGAFCRGDQRVVIWNPSSWRLARRSVGSALCISTEMGPATDQELLFGVYASVPRKASSQRVICATRHPPGFGKRKRTRQAEASTDLEAFTLTRGSPYVTIGGSFGFFGNCTRTSRNGPSGLASASARARSFMAAVCSL